MGIDEQVLEEVVRRVVGAVSPSRIILFGSAAEGTMTPDSDIDLLVLEDDPRDVVAESARIRSALRGLDYPFDVFVMPTVEFEESKGVIGGLAHPANKYGKVIYEIS